MKDKNLYCYFCGKRIYEFFEPSRCVMAMTSAHLSCNYLWRLIIIIPYTLILILLLPFFLVWFGIKKIQKNAVKYFFLKSYFIVILLLLISLLMGSLIDGQIVLFLGISLGLSIFYFYMRENIKIGDKEVLLQGYLGILVLTLSMVNGELI